MGDALRLKVEVLAEHTDSQLFKRWFLLNPEAHTVSKMAALLDRPYSEKGRKDAREVMAMLFPDGTRAFTAPDPKYAVTILLDATAGPIKNVPGHIERVFELLPETVGPTFLGKKRRRELDVLAKVWANEAKDQLAVRRRPQGGPTFS